MERASFYRTVGAFLENILEDALLAVPLRPFIHLQLIWIFALRPDEPADSTLYDAVITNVANSRR